MKLVTYCASPIADEPIEPLTITATKPGPSHSTLEKAALWHKRRGREIAEALWLTLPGATVDQVLVSLLQRRASQLEVRHRR